MEGEGKKKRKVIEMMMMMTKSERDLKCIADPTDRLAISMVCEF